jgi:D-serine deaminase-like pyridoxal phosphate-dependent protein
MWYDQLHTAETLTPALLIHPETIAYNISEMIRVATSADRLRPHIKTVKMQHLISLQQKMGISKFKCATMMEAKMLAEWGVKDVLWAYPLVGPNQEALLSLIDSYPQTTFSTLVDHQDQLISWTSKSLTQPINLYIDVNVGMNRTGVEVNKLSKLVTLISRETSLNLAGIHAYDGHNHHKNPQKRTTQVQHDFDPLFEILSTIGISKYLEIVCGGSITFHIHAQDPKRTLSPGTTLLWDTGYQQNFPDLSFRIAACLLTRIISKPANNLICLDIGHKAVASEMKTNPIIFPSIKNYTIISHSEEHLTLKIEKNALYEVGDVLIGLPWHICPTVALHQKALVVQENKIISAWEISGRNRLYQL